MGELQSEATSAGVAASDNPSGPESGSSRVFRGGSWYGDAGSCRSAFRSRGGPSNRDNYLGFRLSRTGPWRSHPITLGGAPPRAETPKQPEHKAPDAAARASAAPARRRVYAPQESFRDRFVIVAKDGQRQEVDAPEMVYLPGGAFRMGDKRGDNDEKPVHPVRLDAFALGRTPVTWGDYQRFCEITDSHWPEWLERGSSYHLETGSEDHYPNSGVAADALDLPVVGISWEDARAYCTWLSEQTGERFVLPTEAQWEYACRAGTETRWSCGDDERALAEHAWYADNAAGKLHPVAQKRPNRWGLYDMHGNCWEWCADWFGEDYYRQLAAVSEQRQRNARKSSSVLEQSPSNGERSPSDNPAGPESGSYRVIRGGSWDGGAGNCRSVCRLRGGPSGRDDILGFRLSRTV